MNPRSRTPAILLGAVVLAGAAGGPGGFDLSALADELGVSESRLQDALESARPTGAGGDAPPDRSAMAETLADELGLSVDKVEEALEAAMPSLAAAPGASLAPRGHRRSHRHRARPA